MSGTPRRVPARIVLAVVLATTLNPLNSSMIALALVDVSHDFAVSLAAAGTLVIAFYVVGAIGQPTMGRLADRFGPRRVFVCGLLISGLASALAPLAPSLVWLVLARMLLGIGSSASYPAGLAIVRAVAGPGPAPTGAMGAMAAAANGMAAAGPAVGGLAVALAGWPAIFLVNLPLIAAALLFAWLWLPSVPGSGPRHADVPRPPLLGLFVHRALRGVYWRFVAVTLAYYGVLFGLPVWLEEERGLASGTVGLLMIPLAGLSMLSTPLAARVIARRGPAPGILLGAVAVTAGILPMLTYDAATPIVLVVLAGAVLGAGLGFTNLGLQTALYERAPEGLMGTAGGLLQTCRYIGAILATAIMGAAFASTVSDGGIHLIAAISAAITLLVVIGGRRRVAR